MDGWTNGRRRNGWTRRNETDERVATASAPASSFLRSRPSVAVAVAVAVAPHARLVQPQPHRHHPSIVDTPRDTTRANTNEWVRPRMRDGTGTFEPMSSDWFATDPRRDAPNAGLTSSSSHPFQRASFSSSSHPARRTRSIRPDPIRSNRPRAHGWENRCASTGRFSRRRTDRTRDARRQDARTVVTVPSLHRHRAVAEKNKQTKKRSHPSNDNVPGRDGGAHGEGHLPSIARAWICRRNRPRPGECRAPRIGCVCFPNPGAHGGTQSLNRDSS